MYYAHLVWFSSHRFDIIKILPSEANHSVLVNFGVSTLSVDCATAIKYIVQVQYFSDKTVPHERCVIARKYTFTYSVTPTKTIP